LFEFSSIELYHAQLHEGRVTCLQTVEHYLQKIRSTVHLNVFIEVFDEEALNKAKQLDEKRRAGLATGKLHGVVIGLKDVICYKDHKLSAASGILQNFTSLYSASAVEHLLQEEAIIIGRLNCDEFAMGSSNENSFYGNVLNAIDETRVPGGSSGGSAVSVQAGLCMISLGSDTGGSVRQPADFCGIIGFKPTYGRISRYGLIAYASSFDQIGIFGTTIQDVAKILEVISGPDDYDSTVSQKNVEQYSTNLELKTPSYRFAYFPEALDHPSLDIEISNNLKKIISELKEAGHEAEPVSFEYLDYIVPTYYILTTAEASSNLARYDGVRYGTRAQNNVSDLAEFFSLTRSSGFGKEVKRRIMLGTFVLSAGYYDAYFTKAQQVRMLLLEKTQQVFNKFDFIIFPTAPSTAFKIGEKMNDPIAMYLADIYTVYANLAGVPAVSIPLFRHSNGMPFGLQLMANRFKELPLLQVSHHLMQHFQDKKLEAV
jgi:aspartyl-tRNA(Asn)/glutamyl-tRNA(Gln) amidotransferase subunit A